MKKFFASMILAAAVAGAAAETVNSSMVCTLTGEQVEQCCCIEKDGALVCTLTGETVSSCCCAPAK
jgi:hypothetical protein